APAATRLSPASAASTTAITGARPSFVVTRPSITQRTATLCAKFDGNASQTRPACGVPLLLWLRGVRGFRRTRSELCVIRACTVRGGIGNEWAAMTGHWIAVASAEHVRRGRREGFVQVSHGKAAPLKRIKPGDRVVYYSPTVTLGGKDKLQAFTAIGV